jgi:dipeptidase
VRVFRFTALSLSLILALGPFTRGLPACTSIMVGAKASIDGSVMTSHTCDSHRTSSAVAVVPAAQYTAGAVRGLTRRSDDDSGPMQRYSRIATGSIPQVASTFGYIAPAYAAMNQRQLAIGESTFDGREELVSTKGLIDCETLTQLMLERASTAREAIKIGGQLLETYGWCDVGEALTVADPHEVWVMEIIGPGKDQVGAVWAAQRVPDDHVSVVANSARIGELDLANADFFLASANVFDVAQAHSYWNPQSGRPFRFYEAYNPDGRTSFASTRREWRALSLLAPSLGLTPNSNVFPFSVKPDQPVSPEKIMELFRDTFEGTEFDMTKSITVTDKDGKTIKSPLANPFMPYDMNKVFRINGGWGELGERPMARWYCMYATVLQCRASLPDPVGGLVWFGYSNPAMATYVPFYAGIASLPDDFQTDGRTTGFSRRAAWWAFNRVATLAAHRWGDMRRDVAAVRNPLQEKLLAAQPEVAATAVRLLGEDPAKAREYLTRTTADACAEATQAYWQLGDLLWTKYNEQW